MDIQAANTPAKAKAAASDKQDKSKVEDGREGAPAFAQLLQGLQRHLKIQESHCHRLAVHLCSIMHNIVFHCSHMFPDTLVSMILHAG